MNPSFVIKDQGELLSQMRQGAAIITPNNRLSNQLLQDFYTHMGMPVIDKPRCLPYQAYLMTLFDQVRHQNPSLSHPIVLNPCQQRYLWKTVIKEQSCDYPCNDGLLHEIQDAWGRCRDWRIDINDQAFSHTPQTEQFQLWQRAYQRALTNLHAITPEQLVDYMMIHLSQQPSEPMVWVCFDDYTPQQRRLQEALAQQGVVQYHYDLPESTPSSIRYEAVDQEDEWLEIMDWLKHGLKASMTRIGVVVPNLQMQSEPLQRWLKRHLPDEQFNISLGRPLTDYPLVTHAMAWLRLNTTDISNHHARLMLHSPYLAGSASEFHSRSHALHTQALLQESEIPYKNWLHAISTTAPTLTKRLLAIKDYALQPEPIQHWIECFKTRLIAVGYPGEYPLNSAAYQCYQRFLRLFDELLPLSLISPLMTASDALDALDDLAKNTIFKTKASTAPIQILGLLEASGCTFEQVWVSGLTSQCLPQKTNPSAFIPLTLQRDQCMPHAVAERELQLAKQRLKRLQNGSQTCTFSYPCYTGDRPNMPSPLIASVPERLSVRLESNPFNHRMALVDVSETYALPIHSNQRINGGTTLLANQAKCPFRAFAAHRLHAKDTVKITHGPDAIERGKTVHRVMELLWAELKSQRQLLITTENELKHLVEQSIRLSFMPLTHKKPTSFSSIIKDVEFLRLKQLVYANLAWEKQRPPFEIEALEQSFSIQLDTLHFSVRIDRLDRLECNGKWVIDYKTNIPTVKPWNEDRPEAPQLLLYALLDDAIDTLLYLQFKKGRHACIGLSEHAQGMPQISPLKKGTNWSNQRAQWREQLSALAHEFKIGHCPPTPSRTSTCMHCEFKPLCRINSL